MLKSTNPEIRRLLGKEGDFGQGIGVDNDWAYQAIKQVGNYGEIFERNLGAGSRLNIARGLNRLWKDGGLQRAADPLMGAGHRARSIPMIRPIGAAVRRYVA